MLCACVLHCICEFTLIHSNIKSLRVSGLETRQNAQWSMAISCSGYMRMLRKGLPGAIPQAGVVVAAYVKNMALGKCVNNIHIAILEEHTSPDNSTRCCWRYHLQYCNTYVNVYNSPNLAPRKLLTHLSTSIPLWNL